MSLPPDRLADVLRIAQEAVARQGAERAEYLDTACGADADLRREVEALLAEQASGDGFLDTPPWQPPQPALMAGQRLGPYEVVGKIGAGGMGAVYKARDTRLARTVALKVIAGAGAVDPAARERFAREAKTIASLNHPHICALHDVGREVPSPAAEGGGQADEPVDFLVMEHLDGETLDHRLHGAKGGAKGKALNVEEATKFGTEIAGALAAAHNAGVVHRDLKPANIMLTAAGAKVLDFGLAKLRRPVTVAVGGASTAVTDGSSVSVPGLMVGTIAYMSPEQARGEAVDARSDIFAFGCVLYEMLSGERPFQGATATDILTAIVRDDPPPLSTPGRPIPEALNRIVRHCLEKDRAQRFESARDVLFDLEGLQQGATAQPGTARSGRLRHRMWQILTLVAVAGGVVASFFIGGRWPASRTEPPSRRFTLTLPPEAPLAPPGSMPLGLDRPALALAGDGSQLAYVAQVGDTTRIDLYDFSTGSFRPVPGTEGGVSPAFSPDGRRLAFFAEGKLRVTSLDGTERLVLADAPSPMGVAWAEDGTIYFCPRETGGLSTVRFPDGLPEPVFSRPVVQPTLLPGRLGVLMCNLYGGTSQLKDGRLFRLQPGGLRGEYARSGHLVFARPQRLLAVRFDPSTGAVEGNVEQLAGGLRTGGYGHAAFALARDGTLVYAAGSHQPLATLVAVERSGTWTPLGLPENTYGSFAVSPDGSRLAVGVKRGDDRWMDLLVYDLRTKDATVLAPDKGAPQGHRNLAPRWYPDGKEIVFLRTALGIADAGGEHSLVRQRADGTTPGEVIWKNGRGDASMLWPHGFGPGGSLIAFGFDATCGGVVHGYILRPPARRPGGTLVAEPLLVSTHSESFPQLSRNGRWLLFTSDETGQYEIHAMPYPGPGPRHQISQGGGQEARWNPVRDDEVVYMRGPRMYSVRVSFDPEFRADQPRLLFEGPFLDIGGFSWDFMPDGERFVMLVNNEQLRPTTTLQVLTNVFAELRRRLPTR
jgi:serine/threonine-protein kinase